MFFEVAGAVHVEIVASVISANDQTVRPFVGVEHLVVVGVRRVDHGGRVRPRAADADLVERDPVGSETGQRCAVELKIEAAEYGIGGGVGLVEKVFRVAPDCDGVRVRIGAEIDADDEQIRIGITCAEISGEVWAIKKAHNIVAIGGADVRFASRYLQSAVGAIIEAALVDFKSAVASAGGFELQQDTEIDRSGARCSERLRQHSACASASITKVADRPSRSDHRVGAVGVAKIVCRNQR